MARRPTALAVVLLTAVVLTGCGSDDASALADATDRTCRDVTAAIATLQRELVRGPGTTEATAVKAAISRYAASVSETAKQLAEPKAGKADAEFQRVAVAKLREHVAGVRSAASSIDGGRLSSAKVSSLVRASAPAMPTIPANLLGAAPECEVAAR